VALPALAAVHRAAARLLLLLLLTAGPPAAQQSIDISWLAAVPTAANPQHWRAAARWDRRTDARQMHSMRAVPIIMRTVITQNEWSSDALMYLGPLSSVYRLVAWHSGRTSVSGRRTFPVLRSTCS